MREKPIIFSGQMVMAILDGKKQQTRRVVKWEPRSSGLPKTHLHDFSRAFVDPGLGGGQYLKVPFSHPHDGWESDPKNDTETRCYCPYGEIGDRLWVRENWSYFEHPEIYDCIRYKADGHCRKPDFNRMTLEQCGSFEMNCDGVGCQDHRWRSPIHMPRWASRITLEITGVRVERLQEISEADAKAEGCKESICLPGDCGSFIPDFGNRWCEINGMDSWATNPWVWVLEFKRV